MGVNFSKIKSLKISLASPETIRSWSYGEVTNSETINYKTDKTESGGLFDEAIFGPRKNYQCACGKYKKIKFRGKVCERCHVEITEAIVRRERMGHIELVAPVAHPWMVKELPNPSKISLLLDLSYKSVEQVVKFVDYIVLDNNGYKQLHKKEIIELSDQKLQKKYRKILIHLIEKNVLAKYDKKDIVYREAQEIIEKINESTLPFSIGYVLNFITTYTGIKFGIGAAAIETLLKDLNLDEELNQVKSEMKQTAHNAPRFNKLVHRLQTIKWFKDSGTRPEWMILKVLPVIPPEIRPIVKLPDGKKTTSEINLLYQRVINRNNALKKFIEDDSPTIILNNSKRLLQEAVDALFDNASRNKPILSRDKRPLKSLTDHLKGKQGIFRQNLLGKRVDYSARSVIVVGPDLKLSQVGIPSDIILEIFRPFIIHELISKYDQYGIEQKPIAANIKIAEQMILKQDDLIWPIVERVIKTRPVLLNRAPTLHALGIQGFEPKMVDGKAIRLHPLSCTAFNADFDGDQMAVHLPLSQNAIDETRRDLMASKHILGPKDGNPIITPTQDMIIGIYYLSVEKLNQKGQGMIFGSVDEVIRAVDYGAVTLHSLIGIPTSVFPKKKFSKEGIIITTPGRIIINSILPSSFDFINNANCGIDAKDIISSTTDINLFLKDYVVNKPFNKKITSKIITKLYAKYSVAVTADTADKIKDLGFKYSTKSGITVSVFDLPSYDKKYDYFTVADDQIKSDSKYFDKGWMTDDERYSSVIKTWSKVKDQVTQDIQKIMNDEKNAGNSVIIMANSGARGNVSQFTQLLGMRGLMNRSYNYERKRDSNIIRDTIEVPIKHSFYDGLTTFEYFNSSYGARKGMTDTAMKTSKAGYMTRKLVDSAQEVIVTEDDCGTTKGIEVSALVDTFENTVIETLADRIANRYAMEDVFDPKTNKKLVGSNEIITPTIAKKIEDSNIKTVLVRSVLHCKAKNGVCRHCFGVSLSTDKPVEIGTAVGVIAAQSIGEPGTQLNLRTFHTGGASGSIGGNIAQGFERLKQLFDMIKPSADEKAHISHVNGVVKSIETIDNKIVVDILPNESKKMWQCELPINALLRVKKDDHVCVGDKINNGLVDIRDLLHVAGIKVVREYLLKEIQKVYRLQGIEISDKYIEIIIHQMTNMIKIYNAGDSKYFIGQVVRINEFSETNKELLNNGKHPAVGKSIIFGLDEIPFYSDSFLSAASFQDTKKVLTNAVIKSQVDNLKGISENVMLGRLIPVGFNDDKKTEYK